MNFEFRPNAVIVLHRRTSGENVEGARIIYGTQPTWKFAFTFNP